MGARDGRRERRRLTQQRAQVLPDQLVELAGRDVARGAARGAVRVHPVHLAAAPVVEVPPVGRTRRACRLPTLPAYRQSQRLAVPRIRLTTFLRAPYRSSDRHMHRDSDSVILRYKSSNFMGVALITYSIYTPSEMESSR